MNFKKVLNKIKPTEQEKNEMFKIVKEILHKIEIKDTVVSLGGSGAKNTWLKDSNEIDIYVRFNYNKFKDNDSEISSILGKALRRKFKNIMRLHGSRDYFQIKYKNFTIEAIPILDIINPEDAKNITDISKLHVDYVLKHLRFSNDIRLAKAFAKANKIYGAESYIGGFSGYLLELLVIHYKGFMNLVKNAAKWKKQTVIGDKGAVRELNESKIGPLIFLDPVQKSRNAAAALSQEKYNQFIGLCKEFLKSKSEKFFELKEIKIPRNAIIINFETLHEKKDIAGAKFVKAFRFVQTQLELEGYKVLGRDWKWDYEKGIHWFLLKENTLEPLIKVKGPPIKFKKDLDRFKDKHKEIFISKGRSFAFIKREYLNAEEFIKSLFKLPTVKDNLRSIMLE